MTSVEYSGDPILRWHAEERTWHVEELFDALWIRDDKPNRLVTVPEGFHTDLASIPRLFRSLIPQVGRHIQPAIVHDLIYRDLEHCGLARAEADQMFLDGMKSVGVAWYRRYTMYCAVRAGGWVTWDDHDGP